MLSAAGVGAGYGFRPGVRYIGGLWFGNLMVGLIVISGLWALVLTIPGLRLVLGVASLCYLGYLALRALLPSVPLPRSVFWALLLSVTVALVDEGFQATSRRTEPTGSR